MPLHGYEGMEGGGGDLTDVLEGGAGDKKKKDMCVGRTERR
jgi:hypothetical protein